MRLTMDERLPSIIVVDPIRVRQVVTNGLTNAAKYGGAAASGEPAQIDVNCRLAEDGRLVIEVLDRGQGLLGRTLADLRQVSGVRAWRTGWRGLAA